MYSFQDSKLCSQRYMYNKKLGARSLISGNDPCSEDNTGKFVDDLFLWPPVEYNHIFCFIKQPGVYIYTQPELMQLTHNPSEHVSLRLVKALIQLDVRNVSVTFVLHYTVLTHY